eukprot:4025258-Amphidinium_carterae.3
MQNSNIAQCHIFLEKDNVAFRATCILDGQSNLSLKPYSAKRELLPMCNFTQRIRSSSGFVLHCAVLEVCAIPD